MSLARLKAIIAIDAEARTARLQPGVVRNLAIRCGGDKLSGVFHLLPSALQAIQRRIKHSFDPQGVFIHAACLRNF
ncbi:hypothetical protein NTGBS_440074 [Candidatus Nitrotoga sp. BS]|uniref:hypothetical protein n=1 Tax=Candidatus Nitrotoga sp. BS TaxID=2890408 RepID=UPI001EF29E67|nr:hypothetical protein [Candidatus Nitrotoga sp. BS]CAH1201398.1 hypothetical protein NTGBS_440074 [Candidatus Nitrotoga sp. BS]